MWSNSPFVENATSLSCLPFTTLIYPKGNYPGSRSKCSFILIPPGDLEMETMIMHSGGQVLSKGSNESEDEYAVTILCERFYLKNPNMDCTLPLDTFSSVYVHEVIEAAKNNLPLPNLNSFRITQSNYQAFKAEEILWKKTKWSDLVPVAKPTKNRITAQQFIERLKSCWEAQPVQPPPSNEFKDETRKVDQTPESKYETAIKVPSVSEALANKSSVKPMYPAYSSNNVLTEDGSLSSDEGVFKKPLKRLARRQQNEQPRTSKGNEAQPSESKRDRKSKCEVPTNEKHCTTGPTSFERVCSKPQDIGNKNRKRLCGRLKISQLTLKAHVRTNPGQKSRKFKDKDRIESVKRKPHKPYAQKETSSTKSKRPACRPFTQEDGQKMLDLVCEKKAFMYTKGEKLFQWMELSQHFPGRTYQSLREHWKKKVHPNAILNQIYNITPVDLDQLLNALKNYKWNKNRNICPDYPF